MPVFCKLADPANYVACRWNLAEDTPARVYWIDFFRKQMEIVLAVGTEAALARGQSRASIQARAERFRGLFLQRLEDFHARPHAFGRVTMLTFDAWRDQLLRDCGFADPFCDLKDRENAAALTLLPQVCRRHDSLVGREQICEVIGGVFAGNIFDMGVEATAKAFRDRGPDFHEVLLRLPPRPWLVDDFDSLTERLLSRPYRKVVFFIDNAGSDFVLGALPMMRWLGRRGARVVLAANETPTLNDMTIHDVKRWWPRIIEAESSLAAVSFEFVSTGTGEPLIDLSEVSAELNVASADADLVVLEGMGRAVESNTDVAMSCDVLNIAMIKDPWTAAQLGGNQFDLVCRFRQI